MRFKAPDRGCVGLDQAPPAPGDRPMGAGLCAAPGLCRLARLWVSRSVGLLLSVGLPGGFLVVATGCAGYHLGPTNGLEAGEKSLQIRPLANQTIEPLLTDAVTQQLRKQVQQDGTFKLSTHGDPDLFLTGVITRYQRTEVTFASTDVLTTRDFRLTLTAQITVIERSTGRELLKDVTVNGYTLVRVGSDLTSAERQVLPLLADDLAKNAVARLAEGKW